MNCKFHRQFLKDIQRLDAETKLRLRDFLEQAKNVAKFSDLPAVKIKGYPHFWRFRLGNYRLGVSFAKNTIIFRRILHRKNIYKRFP